jgi:alkylation response protein AidB-like acyl-CoA dehydrogenase
MDFKFDAKHEAFRQEVRAFIGRHLTPDIQRSIRESGFFPPTKEVYDWQRRLIEKGWNVPSWPVEHGGCDWTPLQHFIFEDEHARVDAPPLPMSPLHMIGPLIYTFGSDYLKDLLLQPMREGRIIWAQGFSEPGAGSDLASLRTRAERDGDEYVVNGQKIWTSGAYRSDWIFVLVKTDTKVKPQQGISMLLCPLNTKGITVRRIPQIDGDAHLCETFFDNVRIPVKNRIGEENKGWSYAKSLLEQERTGSAFVFWSKRELAKAREIATKEKVNGVRVIDLPAFSQRFARAEAQINALEFSVLRVLAGETFAYSPMAIASSLKLRGSALQQTITMLQMDCLGPKGLRFIPREDYAAIDGSDDPLWPAYMLGVTPTAMITRAATIYGGAQQIQKTIISKLAFNL